MDTGMNEKRPQQVGTSWGRLFFRWGLGAETGSPCKTRCERPGSPIRVLEFNATPSSPTGTGDHRKPRRRLAKDPAPLTVPPAICHQEDDLFPEGL